MDDFKDLDEKQLKEFMGQISVIMTVLRGMTCEEDQNPLSRPVNLLVYCLAHLGLLYGNPDFDKDYVKEVAIGLAKNLQANR